MSFEQIMLDCANHASERAIAAERLAERQAQAADDFTAAVLRGDMDSTALGQRTGARVNGVWMANSREELLWETMDGMTDYGDLARQAMQALALCAKKGNVEALAVVKAMADKFADVTVENDE